MAMAGDDGTFTIGEVLPGTYRISATANVDGPFSGVGAVSVGFVDHVDTAEGFTPAPSPGTITVGSADIAGLIVVVNA
jgi:hypothetical protein